MDQSAFRAMLASTSAASSSSSKPKPPKFGAAPPKRSAAFSATLDSNTAASASKPEFKPRAQKDKSKYKKQALEAAKKEGAYRDRAAERRTGGPSDFAEAEKLLQDFQARAENAEVDKETLEEQMKYLGGDAEHSVLVKGLDMALLEREKAKAAGISDQNLEDMEDELDRELLERKSGAGNKKKRTRDDMIAELKARGAGAGSGGTHSTVEDSVADKKIDSRFKPVGWKKVGSTESQTDPEKKRRKKKKVVKTEESSAPPTAPESATESAKVAAVERSDLEPVEPAARARPLPIEPTIDLDNDDFDIFGDAGDYKGLDTDSDEDEEANLSKDVKAEPAGSRPSLAPPSASGQGHKMKYFDDDPDDTAELETTAPSSVTQLRSQQLNSDSKAASRVKAEDGASDDETGGEERLMRLEPLSRSAIPSVKDLLAMDAEAEKAESRKARKAKYQLKAAEKKEQALAKMTPAERAEHDHQVMMSFLEKKERRAKGEVVEDDNGDPPF